MCKYYSILIIMMSVMYIASCSKNSSPTVSEVPAGNPPVPEQPEPNKILYLEEPQDILYAPIIEQQLLVGGTKIHGVNFGPFVVDGTDPINTTLTELELMPLLQGLTDYTGWIRTYGTSNGLDLIAKLGRDLGFSTAIGAWIGSDIESNNEEIETVVSLAKSGNVDMVIIGSEVLLRNDLTELQLVAHVNQAKMALPGRSIACADDIIRFIDNSSYRDACDIWLVNYYPYVDGVSIHGAIAALNGYYDYLFSIAGGKPILISETGWPTSGPQYGDAVASSNNSAYYFINFISWAKAKNVDYFYFEAYDEPWKDEGGAGPNWGIWDQFGNMKPGMEAVLNGYVINDNWN